MWICLNNAFISIVEPADQDVPRSLRVKGWQGRLLMVRARQRCHLVRLFPKARVFQWKFRDYPFRVFIDRSELAAVIGAAVAGVSYPNFKSSVRDDALHDAYSAVWGVMNRYGNGAFTRRAWSPLQRDFAWGTGEVVEPMRHRCESCQTVDGHEPGCPENDFAEEPCATVGCNEMNPCINCMTAALAFERDKDDYGPFGDDDIGAKSHLQVPPR